MKKLCFKLLLIAFLFNSAIKTKAQLPFNQGFENGGSMPTGWTKTYVASPAGNIEWVFQNGGYDGNPANAHTGSYNACFFIESYGDDGAATKLISPSINLTGAVSPTLTFWHAQAVWGADQDQLKVYIKTSSAGSWISVGNYTTNVANWTKRTINLPSPTGTYYIAFEGIAHYGYGVCIDDVDIFDAASADVAITKWISPQIGDCNLSSTTNIKVQVKNLSTASINNIPIKYSINGGSTYVNETITTTVNSGDTLNYTFSTPANFSANGAYSCSAIVSVTGDINQNNDSAFVVIKNTKISTFPFIENFETGTTDYFSIKYGAQANSYIYNQAGNKVLRMEGGNSAVGWSGSAGSVTETQAWNSNISHQSSSITCNVDATSLTSVELLLDLKQFYSDYDPDYSWFRVLVNNIQINDVNGVSNFHPTTLFSDPFTTLKFNLSAYSGTQFSLTLQSSCKYSESYSTPGDIAFVDNVIIRQISSLDAGVFSINSPISGCGFTSSEIIAVKIKNYGTDAISGFTVNYKVDTSPIVTETVSSIIASGDSLYYTFLTPSDLSEIGNYTIIAWTDLAGDEYFFNDSQMVEIFHYPNISSFPFIEDFESGNSHTFILQSNEQSNTLIYYSGNNNVLKMEGGIDGLYWTGNTGSTTPANAWNDNVKYQSKAITCNVDATSLSSLELLLDLKQTVSNSLSGTKLSWFRVLVNGVQVSDIHGVSNFNPITPSADPFKTDTFDLSLYAGMQFTLTLQSSCKYNEITDSPGDNVFIDNIILKQKTSNDASVIALTSPISDCSLSAYENVTVQIKNSGINAISNFIVAYNVDGGVVVKDSIFSNLVPNQTLNHTFTSTIDLSATSVYHIKAWTELTNDQNSTNDTVSTNIENYGFPLFSLGYDTIITQQPDTVVLNAGEGFSSYYWLDGWSGQTYNVSNLNLGWYSVTVTDENNCSAADSVYIDFIDNLTHKFNNSNIRIYPNPTNGYINITTGTNNFNNMILEITNIHGQMMYSEVNKSLQSAIRKSINISDFPKGLYFLKIKSNEKLYIEKIIIN